MEDIPTVSSLSDPVKVVICGDVGSGKTWLWQSYFQNRRPASYTQTIFDNYSASFKTSSGREIFVSLFETCGDEDYTSLRKLSYAQANLVMLCIAMDDKDKGGGRSRIDMWSHELKVCCKGVPILVVGTKKDLLDVRNNTTLITTTSSSGSKLKRTASMNKGKVLRYKDIVSIAKNFKYAMAFETSSLSKDGLQSLFQTAVKMGLNNKLASKELKRSKK